MIDIAAATSIIDSRITDSWGASPATCIDLLQIRPLLVGTAWKVLDLLLETALELAGEGGDQKNGRWTITRKVSRAGALAGQPPTLTNLVWEALMQTYVKTKDLRHSLVHRTVYTDPSGSLIGQTGNGTQLPPMTPEEQEAFGRVALRASEAVSASDADSRVENDLAWQLAVMTGVHGVQLPAATIFSPVPEVVAIIDADPDVPDRYLLDVPKLRQLLPFPGAHADLTIQPRDRDGFDLRGRLEDAPQEMISLDFAMPPSWLTN